MLGGGSLNQYDPIIIIEQGYEPGLHHDLGCLDILLKAKVSRQVASYSDIRLIFQILLKQGPRIFRYRTVLKFYYPEFTQVIPALRAVDEDHAGREYRNNSDPLSLEDMRAHNSHIRVLDDVSDLHDSLCDA